MNVIVYFRKITAATSGDVQLTELSQKRFQSNVGDLLQFDKLPLNDKKIIEGLNIETPSLLEVVSRELDILDNCTNVILMVKN